jgi:hypothetical protein
VRLQRRTLDGRAAAITNSVDAAPSLTRRCGARRVPTAVRVARQRLPKGTAARACADISSSRSQAPATPTAGPAPLLMTLRFAGLLDSCAPSMLRASTPGCTVVARVLRHGVAAVCAAGV